jgi:hypothetical protein
MSPAQSAALAAAHEILGEHFPAAVIIAQPEERERPLEVRYTGSWHAVASLAQQTANLFDCNVMPDDHPEHEEGD